MDQSDPRAIPARYSGRAMLREHWREWYPFMLEMRWEQDISESFRNIHFGS